MRSITIRSSCLFTAVLISAVAGFGQSQQLSSDLERSFAKFDIVRMQPQRLSDNPNSKKDIAFTGTRGFELQLTPHDLRAPQYRAQNTGIDGETVFDRSPVNTYRGSVAGQSGSKARINILGSKIEGFFTDRGETLFIEPASKYSDLGQSEYVVYRMEDVLRTDPLSCGSDIGDKIEDGKSLAGLNRPETVSAIKRIQIATEADFEYVNSLGGTALANAEILGILNTIEGLYESQLDLTFNVVFQHTWTTPDPFTAVNSEFTVRNFQAHWNSNYPLAIIPRDAAHLFSGKSNVLSQGWAFIGVLCRTPEYAYGMSGYVDWAPAKYLITAHEIGHNLGGGHVEAAQNCGNSLMNSQLTATTPLSFCQLSRDDIGTYLFTNGSCITPGSNCRFDFDSDAKADISVFRPSNGGWYLNRSNAGFLGVQFGQVGDKPVSGDYDGDGVSDPAVYRNGMWFRLKSSTGTFDGIPFGLPTDIPAPGDFDGDGITDVAVFRPSDGVWYKLLSSTGGFSAYQFGQVGDIPIPADYDADGIWDINVFRPSNGVWFRINSRDNSFYAAQFGAGGDKAVTGDFDGDGKADLATWRPSTGVWFILRADGSFYGAGFGSTGDIPTPADFDGDGRTDLAVYRPSTGVWYRLDSGSGGFVAYQFGISTDQPIASYYIP